MLKKTCNVLTHVSTSASVDHFPFDFAHKRPNQSYVEEQGFFQYFVLDQDEKYCLFLGATVSKTVRSLVNTFSEILPT